MNHLNLSKAFFWEEAPFFRLLLPLAAVIVLYGRDYLPGLSVTQLTIALIWLLAVFLSVCFVSTVIPFPRWPVPLFVLIITFVAGWLLCTNTDIRNHPDWFGHTLDNSSLYKAVILEKPSGKTRTWKLRVRITESYKNGKVRPVTGEAFLYVYRGKEPFSLNTDDRLILPGGWQEIRNSGNPEEFDYAGFCKRRNIHHLQFIAYDRIQVYQKSIKPPSVIQRTHDWAMQILHTTIPDKASLGLMQAMLLGDDALFDPDMRQHYADTGIIHIVAISGGHVMAFFQIITMLLFWIKGKRYEYIHYLVAVPLIIFYVAVAGAPASAVRSAVMFSVLAAGILLRKKRHSFNLLFATAFFMLLYKPMWFFDVGFQLSFVAVLSLMIFHRPVTRWLTPGNKWLYKLWQAAAASIAAEILVAPVIIFYFHSLPVTFLIANVLAYCIMGVVLSSGILLLLLSWIPQLVSLLGVAISLTVAHFNGLITILQTLNPLSFKHLYLSLPQLILLYLFIAAIAVFFLKRSENGLAAGLMALCLLFILLIADKWQSLTQQQFIVYNINGKNCAELINGNRYMPVVWSDSLETGSDYATKEYRIAARAWQKGPEYPYPLLTINGKTLFILSQPPVKYHHSPVKIDYLLLNYSLGAFNAPDLYQHFGFKCMIVTGNQKRHIIRRWRDSCTAYRIPVHFTLLDGAFILK